MARNRNTTTSSGGFSQDVIDSVWKKGEIIAGYESSVYRKDACGAWMQKSEYGNTTTYGWEIDHIKPVSKGGSDNIVNLQPLHWENNRGKSDDYPNWKCTKT